MLLPLGNLLHYCGPLLQRHSHRNMAAPSADMQIPVIPHVLTVSTPLGIFSSATMDHRCKRAGTNGLKSMCPADSLQETKNTNDSCSLVPKHFSYFHSHPILGPSWAHTVAFLTEVDFSAIMLEFFEAFSATLEPLSSQRPKLIIYV